MGITQEEYETSNKKYGYKEGELKALSDTNITKTVNAGLKILDLSMGINLTDWKKLYDLANKQ
jgi:hypothetical protein